MESELWGVQTSRALDNFGRSQTPSVLIRAYAQVKQAVFSAIQETGYGWEPPVAQALIQAAGEVAGGIWDHQFPLGLQQGGAGTSLNQNMNEVLASFANKRLHEIDSPESTRTVDSIEDCNRFQSTNDTFSTAATVCLYRKLEEVEASIISLQEALIAREKTTRLNLITARTELQDALPMTLAQVFSSWAGMVERDRWRAHKLKERLRTVALGGTAVGTGFGAPVAYVHSAERHLRKITGLPLSRSQNLTDEVANADKWAELAGGYDLAAGTLWKISGDLLLYTSSLAGEMEHPELQDGSTQMAVKTNPVLLEMVRGLSVEVQGEASKVRRYAQEGQLQLNAYLPFLVQALLKASDDLVQALNILGGRLIPSLGLNTDRMEAHLAHSPALLNALVPYLGYARVKELGREWKKSCPREEASLETLAAFLELHTGKSGAYWKERLSLLRITGFYQKEES